MNPSLPLSRNRRGFTLIELLVVIAIIALLAAFLFPAVRGAMRAAQTSRTKANMKQVVAGMLQYKDNNDYFFPASGGTLLKDAGSVKASLAGGAKGNGDRALDSDRALYTFIRDAEVFESPSDRGAKSKPAPCSNFFEQWGSSFLYAGENNVGIMGMTTSGGSGRRYTDAFLGASSLKILFYEPPFLNKEGKADNQAQWHDPAVGTVAGFLDGHVDFVKKVNETMHVTGSGTNVDAQLKALSESKRGYY